VRCAGTAWPVRDHDVDLRALVKLSQQLGLELDLPLHPVDSFQRRLRVTGLPGLVQDGHARRIDGSQLLNDIDRLLHLRRLLLLHGCAQCSLVCNLTLLRLCQEVPQVILLVTLQGGTDVPKCSALYRYGWPATSALSMAARSGCAQMVQVRGIVLVLPSSHFLNFTWSCA
jgi:hypothetical protein